jgi:HD-GYP domain-containing protein (c-di-GMP phosphodiesterase class II)
LGKISVPAEILSKPSRLTVNEFNLIKEHPQVGYDILKDIEFPWEIATMVYQHHEKLDGSGYPLGLSGNEILPESRVLTVADVVEAMASHRPYRPGLGIDIALDEIQKNQGRLYDPEVTAACQALFRDGRFSFDK